MLHGRDGPDGKAFRDPVTEQVKCVKDPVAEPGFAGIEGSPVASKFVECAQDVFDMAKLPKLKTVVVCRKGRMVVNWKFSQGGQSWDVHEAESELVCKSRLTWQ